MTVSKRGESKFDLVPTGGPSFSRRSKSAHGIPNEIPEQKIYPSPSRSVAFYARVVRRNGERVKVQEEPMHPRVEARHPCEFRGRKALS
jgi:hypothetical protein